MVDTVRPEAPAERPFLPGGRYSPSQRLRAAWHAEQAAAARALLAAKEDRLARAFAAAMADDAAPIEE